MSRPSYKLSLATPPVFEPVETFELKQHLRIDHDAEDAYIDGLIAAARDACEQYTGLSLITRTYTLTFDSWPQDGGEAWWDGVREGAAAAGDLRDVSLPRPPLRDVLGVRIYTDDAGNDTYYSAANYFADLGTPGRIVLKPGAPAPQPGVAFGGIEITYMAGYGDYSADIPPAIRRGILQLAAHLYENRGDGVEDAMAASGAEALFRPFRPIRLA